MLKIELGRSSIDCKVELDGVDISRRLVGLRVDAQVGDLSLVTLQYSGAVVIEGETGRLTLEQAPHYVECVACGKALAGDRVETPHVIQTSALGDEYASQTVVQEEQA